MRSRWRTRARVENRCQGDVNISFIFVFVAGGVHFVGFSLLSPNVLPTNDYCYTSCFTDRPRQRKKKYGMLPTTMFWHLKFVFLPGTKRQTKKKKRRKTLAGLFSIHVFCPFFDLSFENKIRSDVVDGNGMRVHGRTTCWLIDKEIK